MLRHTTPLETSHNYQLYTITGATHFLIFNSKLTALSFIALKGLHCKVQIGWKNVFNSSGASFPPEKNLSVAEAIVPRIAANVITEKQSNKRQSNYSSNGIHRCARGPYGLLMRRLKARIYTPPRREKNTPPPQINSHPLKEFWKNFRIFL